MPHALSDFTFPDYGNVIFEHLGLTSDPEYMANLEKKAAEYEIQGKRYFRTQEDEISMLPDTVDRLQNQFRIVAETRYGSNRVLMIKRVEAIRRTGTFQIGRAIGDFMDLIFEATEGTNDKVVALSLNPAIDKLPSGKLEGYGKTVWTKARVGESDGWIAVLQT